MKAAAVELGLPVAHRVDDALERGADLGVVVAYGALVKPHVLAALPMINLHFSLLPRWRGAAPVERALLAGDTETGVCVMQLEEGLDTGAVYACGDRSHRPGPVGGDVAGRRSSTPARRCSSPPSTAGCTTPGPQEGEATYAAKIEADELRLDWSRPAVELDRRRARRRGVDDVPGQAPEGAAAAASAGDVRRSGHARRRRVATGDGGSCSARCSPRAEPPNRAAAWRNGARPGPGEALGR